MNETVFYVLCSLSLILSIVSLILSTIAIAVIIGFKNSTHRIEWKPLEPVNADPFSEKEDEADVEAWRAEFLKPKIKNPFPKVEIKEDEPFADLEDPNEISHNW